MRRLAAALCAAILSVACSAPPQKEIDHAQGAIDAARAAGAERYAPEEFAAATTALDQAYEAVAGRDYRTALSRALAASERATDAARQAADGKARARAEAEVSLTSAVTSLQQLRAVIETAERARLGAQQLKEPRAVSDRIAASLQEAREHIAAERYPEATAALTSVDSTVTEQIQAINQMTGRPRPIRRRR